MTYTNPPIGTRLFAGPSVVGWALFGALCPLMLRTHHLSVVIPSVIGLALVVRHLLALKPVCGPVRGGDRFLFMWPVLMAQPAAALIAEFCVGGTPWVDTAEFLVRGSIMTVAAWAISRPRRHDVSP